SPAPCVSMNCIWGLTPCSWPPTHWPTCPSASPWSGPTTRSTWAVSCNLARWGLQPEVVVSDGSSLYPELLADIWPGARHQLCVFHLLRDVLDQVLEGVKRLRRAQTRRGRAGRKRRP